MHSGAMRTFHLTVDFNRRLVHLRSLAMGTGSFNVDILTKVDLIFGSTKKGINKMESLQLI